MADSHDTVVTNEKDRKELKQMIVEMTNCLSKIDGEREQMKEIAAATEDKFNIKKKVLNKLARTMYKHSYADVQEENDHFSFLYESIFEGRLPDTDGE